MNTDKENAFEQLVDVVGDLLSELERNGTITHEKRKKYDERLYYISVAAKWGADT